VSGFMARVQVVQTFYNPTDERIEAVYVFPLPHEAAVDDMTLVIGSRKIVGVIKRRAEARQIYEEALAAGQTAALVGSGAVAEQVRKMFPVFRQKFGLEGDLPELDFSRFSPPVPRSG